MRIVHASDFYLPRVGGVEQQVHQLAQAQAAAGHDVHVVTATNAPADVQPDGFEVHRLPADGRHHTGLLAGRGALRAVGPAIADLKPDVVHAHSSVLSPFALVAAAGAVDRGVPAVVTVHSMWASLTRPYAVVFRRVGLRDRPLQWTAVSAIAAAHVAAAVGPRHDVRVLPNGIDVDGWLPAPAPPAAAGPVHVVSVLRFAPRKRPLALVRALRRARAAVPADVELRATLAGGGPLRHVARAYLRAAGMPWVSLPGTLTHTEVGELLRSGSLFVSSARLESFGIAALEARCSGLPVVALEGTGIADFVRDGVEGLLVADDDGLTDAVATIATDDRLRADLTAGARAERPPVGWPQTLAAAADAYAAAARLLQP